jgi:ATP-dependent helicase/DNAse subunit B
VLNFLKTELEAIESGDEIRIVSLETSYERVLTDARLPFPVLIKGNVDRIELRNGKIRIIDYKTGKVDKNNVVLKDWNGLTNDIKNDKIIQLLAYAFMYAEQAKGQEVEAGIISFKNLKSGFLPFQFKQDKDVIVIISGEIMENYLNQIVILLQEIFNIEIPFEEKV